MVSVLVAEDDPDQLMIRSMLLRRSGFHVVEASSYQAAMEAAATEQIRCALVDLGLPREEDGLRLLRDLKTSVPATLVFVLTGSRSLKRETGARLALADGVFGKGEPIRPWLERLNELLQDV